MPRAAATAAALLWAACLAASLTGAAAGRSTLTHTFALPTSCQPDEEYACTLNLSIDIRRDNTTPLLDTSTLNLRSADTSPTCDALNRTLGYNTTSKLFTDSSVTVKYVNTDVVLVTFANLTACTGVTGGLYAVSGEPFPEPPAVSTLELALPTLTNCSREVFFPCTNQYSVISVGSTVTLHSSNNSSACGDVGIGTTRYGNTTTGNFVDGNSFLIQPSSYIDYIDVILGGRCQGTYEVFGDPVLGVAPKSPGTPQPGARSPVPASPSPTPAASPSVPPKYKPSCASWFCYTFADGASIPLRINAAGDTECMSTNGYDCFWGRCGSIQSPPAGLEPNVCSDKEYADKLHWCSLGRAACTR